MSLPGSNTALLASSGTITISEDTISAFIARAGTNLVCYIDGGHGSQEGNPDANPCSDCGFYRDKIDEVNEVIDYWNKQLDIVDNDDCYYFPDGRKRTVEDAIQEYSNEKRLSIYSKCPIIIIGIINNIGYWLNCLNYELNKAAKSTLKNEIRGYKKGAEIEKEGWCRDYCLAYCDRNDDEDPLRGKKYGKDCGCSGIRNEH